MRAIKLNMTQASLNFGISRSRLEPSMRKAGHDLGAGCKWTIKQIYAALCDVGDRDSVKYRREAAEAELAEIEVAKARRDSVDVAEVTDLLDRILQPLRTRLLALPATLGLAANPVDPVFGRQAVAAAVDGLLPMLRDDVIKAFEAGPIADDNDDGAEEDEEEAK